MFSSHIPVHYRIKQYFMETPRHPPHKPHTKIWMGCDTQPLKTESPNTHKNNMSEHLQSATSNKNSLVAKDPFLMFSSTLIQLIKLSFSCPLHSSLNKSSSEVSPLIINNEGTMHLTNDHGNAGI